MRWILRFPDFYTPVAALWQSMANLDIGMHIGQFLFAGIIPGTNVEISFYHIVWFLWVLIIFYIGNNISKIANNSLISFKLYKKPS